MRIYLFNDTSSGHAGSRAVMRSLHYRLRDHKIIKAHNVHETHFDAEALKACDAVVVNGEGTIHHNAPAGDFLMELLDLAQAMGKRTLLVNSVFQQRPSYYPRSLRYLDFCAVREVLSKESIMECGAPDHTRVLLDSCADFRFLKVPTPKRRTGIAIGKTHPDSPLHGVLDTLCDPELGMGVVTLDHADFNAVVDEVSSYEVYVTGQHHGVYAAALSGAPFVALPSNSHKIEGLIQQSGLPISVCTEQKELWDRIEEARAHKYLYREFGDFIRRGRVFDEQDFEEAMMRPQTEELIKTSPAQAELSSLPALVSGQEVRVILGGQSAQWRLYKRIKETVVVGVNNIPNIEENIISPAKVDIAVISSDYELNRLSKEIDEFLTRPVNNLLLTAKNSGSQKFMAAHPKKIAYAPALNVQINTLANALVALIYAGARKIVLYGLDGVLAQGENCRFDQKAWKQTYANPETYPQNRPSQLMQETHWLNRLGARLVEEAKEKSGNHSVEIINANPNSAVTAFPKVMLS